MHNEEQSGKKDPFREENLVFKHTEDTSGQKSEKYFKLHIDNTHEILHKSHKKPQEDPEEPKTIKDVFKNAGRQVVASFIILVIGFLALNWSSYYQIAKNEIEKLIGTQNPTQLQEIIGDDTIRTASALETSDDPEIIKKQIPKLNIEITPSDNRLIIPRINQNIPIVGVGSESLIKRDWNALEKEMQDALQGGVVHYPGTSLPGQPGNVAITGHSSYFPWDPGRFKSVFALLHDLVVGDDIVIYHEQEKFTYKVKEIKIVLPTDIEILKQTPEDRLTLITCHPIGTNLKRLIVIAEPFIQKKGKIAR